MSDSFTHDPLPYIVRTRSSVSDDAQPVVTEHRLTAYGVFEAVVQACVLAGGHGLDDPKIIVEDVRPDVPEFMRQQAEKIRESLRAAKADKL